MKGRLILFILGMVVLASACANEDPKELQTVRDHGMYVAYCNMGYLGDGDDIVAVFSIHHNDRNEILIVKNPDERMRTATQNIQGMIRSKGSVFFYIDFIESADKKTHEIFEISNVLNGRRAKRLY